VRPLDVIDLIMTEPRLSQEDEGNAIVTWGTLVERIKPGQAHMAMSPQEVERAKRILAQIADCLNRAHAYNPSPLRPVEKDGR
jgi:hypothetical protein